MAALKAEKLRIDRWRESIQVTAQVKTMIDHNLQWLPKEPYPDEEADIKSLLVYQHIYANSGNIKGCKITKQIYSKDSNHYPTEPFLQVFPRNPDANQK